MLALVFIGNIEYCPYLEKYKKKLEDAGTEYEVLFWNREGLIKEYPKNYIYFDKKSALQKKKIYKLLEFLQYERWLKQHIKNKKYSKLVLLDTLSGILLSTILLSEYNGNYVFDIRDYSYEKIKLFYRREKKIIYESYFTCISSEGFKSFLPKNYEYTIAHNFNYNDLIVDRQGFFRGKIYGDTINIVWIGSVRYYKHQVNIIDKLKNDSRFNIIFHGAGPDLDRLIIYSKENNVNNIKFTGMYDNSDKVSLLSYADIINNSYDVNIGLEVKYAIANKFYDGLIFRIPQLVEKGTYKEERINAIGIGIGLDVYDIDFADKLYNYYFAINEVEFNMSCERELSIILKQDAIYLEKIQKFLNK